MEDSDDLQMLRFLNEHGPKNYRTLLQFFLGGHDRLNKVLGRLMDDELIGRSGHRGGSVPVYFVTRAGLQFLRQPPS